MERNIGGGKIREPAGGNVVYADPCRFAKALNFEFAESLLVFEKPESGANDLTGVAESAVANIRLNELFEPGREVDVLGWHNLKMQGLARIVNRSGLWNFGMGNPFPFFGIMNDSARGAYAGMLRRFLSPQRVPWRRVFQSVLSWHYANKMSGSC